jgi:dipeptidyl-peptidase-4
MMHFLFVKIKFSLLVIILLFHANGAFAQQKLPVTVSEIFQKGTFRAKYFAGLRWLGNGDYYTSIASSANYQCILKHQTANGNIVDTLLNTLQLNDSTIAEIEEYTWSSNEHLLLFETASERIYRRSSKSVYYVYDLRSKQLKKIAMGQKCAYATFSPDGNYLAYVRDNNLFVTDLSSMTEVAITTSGLLNHIIHGSTDWVYEEEFEFAQAFFWGPDSKRIAFYTFDESGVKEYNMQTWGDLYPKDYKFKYPKAGENNSEISISVFDIVTRSTNKVDLGVEKDIYIPRITWTQNPNVLAIKRLNRLQNTLEIIHYDMLASQNSIVYTETSDSYVEINNDWHYCKDNNSFIISSEKDGYRHLYRYDLSGNLLSQITKGEFEITRMVAVDDTRKLVYFTSAEVSAMESHFYVVGFDGANKTKLSKLSGSHDIEMSPDAGYYLDYHSDINTPPTVSLFKVKKNQLLTVVEANLLLKSKLTEYAISPAEFFHFKTTENVVLNGWMIKPLDFDSTKKYPVLMYVYGGPGVQTVTDEWSGGRYLWHQALANLGYIIISVDNRGTGSRGAQFKKCTYGKLGELETHDQIEAAAFIRSFDFVDTARIGIWGWSFGGYMSSLCLLYGNEIFKMAIAVAPVTNWRFYDNIYTERYLKTPQLNPDGYDRYSPVTVASRLKGNYLLVHGTSDDNVHYQNAVAMQDALIKANKQFSFFAYPNKAHGISGGNTSFHLFTMLTDFILKNL